MPKKQIRWIIGNEEDGVTLYALSLFTPMFLFHFARLAKAKPFYHAIEIKNGHMRWFTQEENSLKTAEELLARVIKRPKYFTEVRKKLILACDKANKFGKKILTLDPAKLSDAQLIKLFDQEDYLMCDFTALGMISTLIEIPHSQFAKYVENFLTNHVEKSGAKREVAEYFTELSAIPEQSMARKEALSLLEIAKKISRSSSLQVILKRSLKNKKFDELLASAAGTQIKKHVKNYSWVYCGYDAPPFGVNKVSNELSELIQDKAKIELELARIKSEQKNTRLSIKKVEAELKLADYEKTLFQALRDTVFMKMCRKDAMTYGFFASKPLLLELAKRAGISAAAAKCIVPGEHAKVLAKDKKMIDELYKRVPHSIYVADSLKPYVLAGKEAEKFVNSIYQEEAVGDITELKGQTACLGKATGAVKIINVPKDLAKMNKGDILVSIATTPDIVSAMKIAGAIVTEQGGITSHAAIVSRELNVPCVIGTKICCKVFKDGDLVEVNANRGIVKKV